MTLKNGKQFILLHDNLGNMTERHHKESDSVPNEYWDYINGTTLATHAVEQPIIEFPLEASDAEIVAFIDDNTEMVIIPAESRDEESLVRASVRTSSLADVSNKIVEPASWCSQEDDHIIKESTVSLQVSNFVGRELHETPESYHLMRQQQQMVKTYDGGEILCEAMADPTRSEGACAGVSFDQEEIR